MIVGIRVEAENIQTGKVKHCNSSYFTMVAKDDDGKNTKVPGLILSNNEDVRRFYNCIKQIALKKERNQYEEIFDYKSEEALLALQNYNVKVEIN
jgi:acyl-CoA hydrolase